MLDHSIQQLPCSTCKEHKPLDQFTKKRATWTGYNTQCKECCGKQRRIYHEANREQQIQYLLHRRRDWAKVGLCTSCGQRQPDSGKKTCPTCIKQKRQYGKKLDDANLCRSCAQRSRSLLSGILCDECLTTNRQKQHKYRMAIRLKVLKKFGGICTCCGESDVHFLAIDHINNDGKKHRAEQGSASLGFYRRLLTEDCPYELQVLCHNCNMAKAFYGICPHEAIRKGLPMPINAAMLMPTPRSRKPKPQAASV